MEYTPSGEHLLLNDAQEHSLLQKSGILSLIDDLRRDNMILRSNNKRMQRECKALKSENEKLVLLMRNNRESVLSVDMDIKEVVRECSVQLKEFARREAQLLLQYRKVKEENVRIRRSLDRAQNTLGARILTSPQVNPVPSGISFSSHPESTSLCNDQLSEKHGAVCHEATEPIREGLSMMTDQITRTLLSPSSILEGLSTFDKDTRGISPD